jgi:hypothetical protein
LLRRPRLVDLLGPLGGSRRARFPQATVETGQVAVPGAAAIDLAGAGQVVPGADHHRGGQIDLGAAEELSHRGVPVRAAGVPEEGVVPDLAQGLQDRPLHGLAVPPVAVRGIPSGQ